jgi:hypothetical protein
MIGSTVAGQRASARRRAASRTATTTPSPKAFRHIGDRAARPAPLPHPSPGQGGLFRLHRGVLQPPPPPLEPGNAQPHRVRKETRPTTGLRCRVATSPDMSTKPGQLQCGPMAAGIGIDAARLRSAARPNPLESRPRRLARTAEDRAAEEYRGRQQPMRAAGRFPTCAGTPRGPPRRAIVGRQVPARQPTRLRGPAPAQVRNGPAPAITPLTNDGMATL